ncbi:hypothetical protein M1N89_00005, partial [Dehalococcoidia bacterium]|nr:hypothetical protein [Dehalococcoidia bacterium]
YEDASTIKLLEGIIDIYMPDMKYSDPQNARRYVEESEVDSFDPQHLSFFNINTPADLERAEQIVSREEVRNDLC